MADDNIHGNLQFGPFELSSRDGQFGNRCIADIKGRGYSFVGAVVPLTGRVSRPELPRPGHRIAIAGHRTRALGCVLFSRRPGPPLYDQRWGPVRRRR
jgi:hypothetical protein